MLWVYAATHHRFVPPNCRTANGSYAPHCGEILHAKPSWSVAWWEAVVQNLGLNFTVAYLEDLRSEVELRHQKQYAHSALVGGGEEELVHELGSPDRVAEWIKVPSHAGFQEADSLAENRQPRSSPLLRQSVAPAARNIKQSLAQQR